MLELPNKWVSSADVYDVVMAVVDRAQSGGVENEAIAAMLRKAADEVE